MKRERKSNAAARIAATALCILSLLTACFLASCGEGGTKPGTPHESASGIPDRYTSEEDKIAVFSQGEGQGFWASDGWRNGYPFNCTWRRDCVSFDGDAMSLSVRRSDNGYDGAEYRSSGYYSYGYYSVSMKAAKCSGVISSFFTYTGHPWDEIDIEFLGDDTTKIQLNYYTKGVGNHEYAYYLGFDGSEDFHEYGFDWQPDSITWYVDGKAVYRATEDIPTTDTQIMMNVWNGEGDGFIQWCGELDENSLPATAQYEWVAYRAAR